MANTVASRKAKGRDFQKKVAQQISDVLGIDLDLIYISPASVNGVDIVAKYDAKEYFPFAVECKKQEHLSLWDAIEQANDNADTEGLEPLLVFSKNREKTYAALDFEFLLLMLNEIIILKQKLGEK